MTCNLNSEGTRSGPSSYANTNGVLYQYRIEHMWRHYRPSSSPPKYSRNAINHDDIGLHMPDVHTVLAFRIE
jgi:hypothetical protein